LRDNQFRRYWVASSISMLGDGVVPVAGTLTVISVLHANAFEVSVISALDWVPSLLFALHAGAWADRARSRGAIMVASDAIRFFVFASIPITYELGVLTLGQVYAVTLIAGIASVFFNVSDSGLLASLVPRDKYVESQSLFYGSAAVTSLAGPSIAGAVVQFVAAPVVISLNALSFLFSALMLRGIRSSERRENRSAESYSVLSGLEFIRQNRVISTLLASAATVNGFNLMFQALLVFFLVHDLHTPAGALGLILAGQAVGSLVGSALAPKLARRLGMGHALLLGSITISAPLMLVPAVGRFSIASAVVIGVALSVSGFGRAVQNVGIGTTFALTVPESMRSRTRGAFQFVSFGVRPLGALAAGLLATLVGIRPTLLIAAAGGTFAFLWLLPVQGINQAALQTPTPS
jgi:MFS family permease